jgi:AraC-like DNA-binding protein
MLLQRLAMPSLRPFVALLWASDGESWLPGVERERVLPTGAMHVVFRLSAAPLRVFDSADASIGRSVGHAIIGGARGSFYVRDVSAPARSVGAMLHPGAARLLFGGSAAELSGKHTSLDDMWGASAGLARERLLQVATPARQLELFESLLAARLPRVRGLHPAVAEALGKLAGAASVREVVLDSGYSHRHFIALFEDAVGLTPKRYSRVLRFRHALGLLGGAMPRVTLSQLALATGYSDQAHFNRDFREMAGVSPERYRAAAPLQPNHVPCPSARSVRSG